MASSTVIRVKRRLEDNPQEALVLVCKRAKTVVDSNELAPSVFLFQGTVNDEENSEAHIKKLLPKEKLSTKNSANIEKIINKLRSEQKSASKESRYEIINNTRGITKPADKDVELNVVDLMKKSKEESSDVKYAYDLYISQKQDFDVSMLDNIVSIEEYETRLLFGSHRDNGRKTPSSDGDTSSDDSNDENNWRNDYPDSDHSSVDEDDMRAAFHNIDIGEELSSDEELQLYGAGGAGGADPDDVARYGSAYAAYKARVLAEDGLLRATAAPTATTTLDDDKGYKDDSDDGFYYGEDEDEDSRHGTG